MAIFTQVQLVSASNATYTSNGANGITATIVRGLNDNWISSSVLVPMTSSMTVLSASFAISASFSPGQGATFPFTGSAQFTGSVGITGSFRVSGSLNSIGASDFSGGDVKITDQTRNFETDVDTVKLKVQKSVQVTGSLNAPSITGSLQGTASWSNNAVTASFVTTAQTASFVTLAQTASFVTTAQTASFVTGSNVFGPNGSNSILTSSFAVTASFALNAGGGSSAFPHTGSAIISGSLIVTGSAQQNLFSGSVASSTCSIDLNTAGLYTVTLNANGTTFFNVTNIGISRTANIVVTTATAATASFSTNVKQATGSLYTPSSGSGRIDILSLLTDGTNVYLTNVKTMS